MKILFSLLMISLLSPGQMFADDLENSRIELEAKKKIHVSKSLKLTSKESQKFWDIYSNYERDLSNATKNSFDLIRTYSAGYKNSNISEQDAQNLLISYFEIEEQKLAIKKSYLPEFQRILTNKKVLQFYQIDNKVDSIIRCDIAKKLPMIDLDSEY